jgi:hypothetical protein
LHRYSPCEFEQLARHVMRRLPRTLRAIAGFVACLAVFMVSSLGLNQGMVLCVDAHGHLALEPAHVRHAHDHEEHADHGPHDFSGDADHGELHTAMGSCWDAGVANGEQLTRPSAISRLVEAAPLSHPVAAVLLCILPSGLTRAGAGDFWGSTARPELGRLRAVVLIL